MTTPLQLLFWSKRIFLVKSEIGEQRICVCCLPPNIGLTQGWLDLSWTHPLHLKYRLWFQGDLKTIKWGEHLQTIFAAVQASTFHSRKASSCEKHLIRNQAKWNFSSVLLKTNPQWRMDNEEAAPREPPAVVAHLNNLFSVSPPFRLKQISRDC